MTMVSKRYSRSRTNMYEVKKTPPLETQKILFGIYKSKDDLTKQFITQLAIEQKTTTTTTRIATKLRKKKQQQQQLTKTFMNEL